jgi:hypothetical protein
MRLATAVLSLAGGGCYRELIVYQARDLGGDAGGFSIDTSQLPADAIETDHNTDDLGLNPSALRVIRPHYRVRIILVPATQMSPEPFH